MTSKLQIKRGGAGAAFTDVTNMTGLKGAPVFDRDTPLINLGMRYADGESAQGNFLLLDPDAEIHSTTYRLPPHGIVLWTEDASGDELWLARNRIAPLDSGRAATKVPANQLEWNVQTVDCNIDLTGNPFTQVFDRPAETDIERLMALQAFVLNGGSSTMATKRRSSTIITADTVANGHLLNDDDTYNLPAKKYSKGTFARDVISDIAERAGKLYGVVIHHDGGSHLCLLYIQELDHATYRSPIKLSQVISEWNPDEPDEPVLEPMWDRGKGTHTDNDGVIDYLVSIWGGTDTDPKVVIAEQDDEADYERWGDTFYDDSSETEEQAENRANAILAARRAPGHRTHQLSIKLHPEQVGLITNGMSIAIKSAVVTPAPIDYVYRRITELRWEHAPDGDYFARIDLDKPLRRAAVRRGNGQPAATSPKPPPPGTPGTPPVACAEIASYTWTYDANTYSTGDGVYSWADSWNDGSWARYGGLFDGGFGWNGLTNDTVFEAAKHAITPGFQVELTVDANNRGSTDLSARQYKVNWYDASGATGSLISIQTILTVAAVNAVNTYTGTLTAPTGAGGFSVLMPRQIGHDNVTLRVIDCSMATPGTDPIPSTAGVPGTVGGTDEGAPSDSDIFIPYGSVLEHLYITEGGPYHDADQIVIDDTADHFVATNVEAALAELATTLGGGASDFVEKTHGGRAVVNTVASSGAALELDLGDGNAHEVTLDADCDITFTGLTNGVENRWSVHVIGDGTHVATFPDVLWPEDMAPTFDPTAESHWLEFVSLDGTNIYGDFGGGSGSGVTFGTPALTLGTSNTAGSTDEAIRRDATILAFDATVPVTQAFGDTAATGSATVAARRDHKHGMPSSSGSGIGEILISDTPSTPLVFADLLQNDDQTDLLYGDP